VSPNRADDSALSGIRPVNAKRPGEAEDADTEEVAAGEHGVYLESTSFPGSAWERSPRGSASHNPRRFALDSIGQAAIH
jgi:hypothetical protein